MAKKQNPIDGFKAVYDVAAEQYKKNIEEYVVEGIKYLNAHADSTLIDKLSEKVLGNFPNIDIALSLADYEATDFEAADVRRRGNIRTMAFERMKADYGSGFVRVWDVAARLMYEGFFFSQKWQDIPKKRREAMWTGASVRALNAFPAASDGVYDSDSIVKMYVEILELYSNLAENGTLK